MRDKSPVARFLEREALFERGLMVFPLTLPLWVRITRIFLPNRRISWRQRISWLRGKK